MQLVEAKWFEYKVVGDSETPMGPVCFLCGRALECFPLEKSSTLLERHRVNANFRAEVRRITMALKKGIEAGRDMERSSQSVAAALQSGVRISMEVGFVEKQVLERHLEVTPEKLGVTLVSVQTPEGLQEGVLMSLQQMPADLPRWHVSLYTDLSRSLHDVLLAAEDVQRQTQATERYQLAMTNFAAKSSVTVPKARKPVQFSDLMRKAKDVQKELEASELAVQKRQELHTKTATGLSDSVGFMPLPPNPSSKGNKGQGRGRGGGRGRPGRTAPTMPASEMASSASLSGRSSQRGSQSHLAVNALEEARSQISLDDGASSAGGNMEAVCGP